MSTTSKTATKRAPSPATSDTIRSAGARAARATGPAAPKPDARAVASSRKTPPKPPPAILPHPPVVKPAKVKKPKLVRDSFTIPKAEYNVLADLKQRAARLSSPAKKSELLRAGVKALSAMTDAAFVAALQAVPTIKTGRPAKIKAD